MNLRITARNKYSCLIELDGIGWGVLPARMLPPLFGTGFEGQIAEQEAENLTNLLYVRARDLLFDYLAKAEHSERQCRLLLGRKQFHPTLIDAAVAKCRELNFLSDARFAELLIRSYLERRASRRAIVAKLREQRIPAEVWEPLMAGLYDKQDAAQGLKEMMAKYLGKNRDLPRPKLKEKAFTHFFRKGFEIDEIREAWESAAK